MTPEERAEGALLQMPAYLGDCDWTGSIAHWATVIRAALAEARDEDIRNQRERLREWLAEHGVQPVKGESMLWTGWYAALAAEREACARLAEANTRYRDCGVQEEIAAAIRARTPR